MDVNDNACFLNKRVALESIASKLGSYIKAVSQRSSECGPGLRQLLRSPHFTIGANQLGLCQYMAAHCAFELGFGRQLQVRQDRIQRVELVKIPMVADRRTRAAVAGFLPV